MTDQTRTTERDVESLHDVENATHRASCDECSAVWLDLERISAEAAQLSRLTPSRDLWAGIESRIESRSDAPVVAAFPRARRSWMQRPPVRLAIAASLLVAATAGITWSIARQGIAADGTTMASTQDPASTAPNGASGASPEGAPNSARLASFDNTVAGMDREIEQLEAILSEHRKDLDPRTIAVLRSNLAVIDAAIRESRDALEADPASRFLAAQVTRAYHSKLTLLRGAATLPTGI